jgi:hypothetical protein
VTLKSFYLYTCHDLQMDMFLVLYKPSMAAQVGVMLVLHLGVCWSESRSGLWQPLLWLSSASADKFRDSAAIMPHPPPSKFFLNRYLSLAVPLMLRTDPLDLTL